MSDKLFQIWEMPDTPEIYMIAGWRQWADAGSLSSGLPMHLIEKTSARKIGEISSDPFYLFQIPGTHDLVRPVIQLEDGRRKKLERKTNEFYFAGSDEKGLIIFLGDEPHLNMEQYAEAFFGAAEELGTRRIISLGGVYGELPFDKERTFSCVYSLPKLRKELDEYAVNFSNYEGGASIGSFMADRAEQRRIEYVSFYGFVPAYDFGKNILHNPGLRIENDYKAWYDVMRRVNHMFDFGMDLSDLQRRSQELIETVAAKIQEIQEESPQIDVTAYLEKVTVSFEENPFLPLGDVWERELRQLFDDDGDAATPDAA